MIHYYAMPGIGIRKRGKRVIPPERIVRIVCEYFQVSETLVKRKIQTHELTEPRHVIWYLMRQKTGLYFLSIAKMFGRTCHSAVAHAVQEMKDRLEVDTAFAAIVNEIEGMI